VHSIPLLKVFAQYLPNIALYVGAVMIALFNQRGEHRSESAFHYHVGTARHFYGFVGKFQKVNGRFAIGVSLRSRKKQKPVS